MKLLLDQNLSLKICGQIDDLFPGSAQVRPLGLAEADDRAVWAYAKENGFTIVSQDGDFAEMATLLGYSPKVIWLRRTGNCPSSKVVKLLRDYADVIVDFDGDETLACLEIYSDL